MNNEFLQENRSDTSFFLTQFDVKSDGSRKYAKWGLKIYLDRRQFLTIKQDNINWFCIVNLVY